MSGPVLAYLLLVPASTWWLGSVLSLLDGVDPADALRRTAWRSLPYLIAAAFLGARALLPALAAIVTALILHVAWTWGLQAAIRRGWLLGEVQD